jgi:hypothetical protein
MKWTHHPAYDSAECRLLAEALDHAWAIFLKRRGLTPENIDTAQAALSYAILDAASQGEYNVRRLAIDAVKKIDDFQPQIRAQRLSQFLQQQKAS